MARNLKRLSRSILMHEGKLGFDYVPQYNRRDGILKKFAAQGRSLSAIAPELAVELIKRGAEIDNTRTWGKVKVAVGFAHTLMRSAAGNPDISTENVIAGYQNVLETMGQNSATLAPTQNAYGIVNGMYLDMQKELQQISKNGEQGRKMVVDQSTLKVGGYKGSVTQLA